MAAASPCSTARCRSELPDGVGLAVIAGLADDVRIAPAGQGTSVTMSWKRRAG